MQTCSPYWTELSSVDKSGTLDWVGKSASRRRRFGGSATKVGTIFVKKGRLA